MLCTDRILNGFSFPNYHQLAMQHHHYYCYYYFQVFRQPSHKKIFVSKWINFLKARCPFSP